MKKENLLVTAIKVLIVSITLLAIIAYFTDSEWVRQMDVNDAYGAEITKGFAMNKPMDNQVRDLDLWMDKLTRALQGNLRFGTPVNGGRGENIQGRFYVVDDTGSADTEFTFSHTLGYTPTSYIVLSTNKAGVVYKSSTAWNSTDVYFKDSVANANITLFIF